MHKTEGKILVTLKTGEQAWMTKREYRNYLKRLEALKSLYDQYEKYEIIDSNDTPTQQIKHLVELGSFLMSEICELADSITVAGYNRVKNEVSQKISKDDFVNIVKYVAGHLNTDKTIDDTKLTDKLLKNIDQTIYKINLKRIFYTNFVECNDFSVPEDNEKIVFPRLQAKNDKRFKEIVKSCAKARKYIDEKLWPAMYEYGKVAEYISKGDLNYPRYKQLVDYVHYADNEDDRFQNQKKRYVIMAKNFMNAYTLSKRYGYNFFDNVELEIYNTVYDDFKDEDNEDIKKIA